MTLREAKTAEIDRNFTAFLAVLPEILPEHRDEWALLREEKIIEFFPTAIDAQIAGNVRFHDRLFSVQKVTDEVIELGIMSYALAPWRP
jgi:hypothetical protein